MRKLFVLLSLCLCNFVSGQITDSSLYHIEYVYQQLLDTTSNLPYSETTVLRVGQTMSHYMSGFDYDKYYDFFTRPHEEDVIVQPIGEVDDSKIVVGYPVFVVNPKGVDLSTQYFLVRNPGEFYTYASFPDKDYLLKEALPDFQWELTEESDEIMGLECKKAKGKWKGRIYTAWFAESIPFNYGPWKFNGLPGIILKVEDSKKEVKFEAIKIILNPEYSKIELNNNIWIPITNKKLNRMIDLVQHDPVGYIKALGGGDPYMQVFIDFYDGKVVRQAKELSPELNEKVLHPYLFVNNPIELK